MQKNSPSPRIPVFTPQQSAHRIGIGMMVLSALVFSTAGLFTKSVTAGAWEVIFWRGVFAALITGGFLIGRGQLRREWQNAGSAGWAVAVIGGLSTAMFIAAFKATSVANVALIYACAPMLTALFAWRAMREQMARPMVIGALGAFAGVAVLMAGSLGGLNLYGDLLALGMTIGMGTIIVIYRRFPNTPAALPMVGSSVLLLPACLWFGAPMAVAGSEIVLLAGFGAVFALASILLAQAAKRVPSGEAALLSTLEAPLAPFLAWIILAEVPPWTTFLGGAMIVLAVLASQLANTRKRTQT